MLFPDQPENFTGPWCGSHDGWRPSVPLPRFFGSVAASTFVMPGLDPGIHHLRKMTSTKQMIAGSSSAKTRFALLPGNDNNDQTFST
jgi:hypothetical protein